MTRRLLFTLAMVLTVSIHAIADDNGKTCPEPGEGLTINSNKQELENNFLHALRTANGKTTDYSLDATKPQEFSKDYKHDNIKMLEGGSYLMPSVTSNIYFRKRGEKYVLFSQSMYPAESLANITLTADANLPNTVLGISFVKYDQTVEKVEVPVATWLAVVKGDGCECFYGFDKQDGKSATIILYAHNPNRGYDHVLTLKCDIDQLDTKSVRLTGTGYMFAPTTNVKDLFYKQPSKKNQTKKK